MVELPGGWNVQFACLLLLVGWRMKRLGHAPVPMAKETIASFEEFVLYLFPVVAISSLFLLPRLA